MATIFPAEMMKNRRTIPSKLIQGNNEDDDTNMYSAEFIDLEVSHEKFPQFHHFHSLNFSTKLLSK